MKKFFFLSASLLALTLCAGASHAQGRGPGGQPPGQPGRGPGGFTGGPPGNQPPPSASGPNLSGPSQSPRNSMQLGPAGRWWDDKSVVRTVGITSAQQHRMDSVFNANKPAIIATYKTLLAEQAKLAQLNKSAQPNQSEVFAQIDAVSQARAALQKATTQMLLQVRQEMAPEQVQKLEQVH